MEEGPGDATEAPNGGTNMPDPEVHRPVEWGAGESTATLPSERRQENLRGLPVVGIGASAGGLEACKLLLAHLPADSGLAFVFVQHLDPTHHSILSDILRAVARMPVTEAVDGLAVKPNHVYVIPPNTELEIANLALRLTPRRELPGPHLPINHFLRSLAQECGERAIAIILSGAGTDGAAGLQAVKAAGGITFAQDPRTATFASMPQAAAATRCVDFVLPPERIAAELVRIGRRRLAGAEEGSREPHTHTKEQFGVFLAALQKATGVDFALYRAETIHRRILRRLALNGVDTLDDYARLIEKDPAEFGALQHDLLIGVTSFFRDPESFESLKKVVLPRLVRDRPADAAIRIWVPGCATGEEAYSIAASLQEYFDEESRSFPVQIFASDINQEAIETARRGRYPESIAADVGPDRLNRHFSRFNGGYLISKTVRDMCIFSRHDLIRDPPFSRLDLISCRNVLIYLGSIRKDLVAMFYYALNPGGFLMLGPSETPLSGELFSSLGGHGIHIRKETLKGHLPASARAGGSSIGADVARKVASVPAAELGDDIDVTKEVHRILLSKYSPSGIVVDQDLEVLEILGQAASYLKLPAGKVNLNLLNLTPQTGLFLEIDKLVRQVEKTGEPARTEGIANESGDAVGDVGIEVIASGGTRRRTFLVLFAPAPSAPASGPESHRRSTRPKRNADWKNRRIATLEQELADLRQRLLSLIEEHRSTEDDSQSATEETLSANEELQSLNEELETAKEELQSTNEELITLNQELRSKNTALIEARDFAVSIIESAEAPLLILDMDLSVKTANQAFYRIFQESPDDVVGSRLYSIANGRWDIPALRDMLNRVRSDGSFQDFEIAQDFPGVGHRVLLLSGRHLEKLGVILLGVTDVTHRQERAEALLHESEVRFRNMADTAPVMIWVSGPDKVRTFFNRCWLMFTGRTMEEEQEDGWVAGIHLDDLARCVSTYTSSFDARRAFRMEYRLRRADGEYRWLLEDAVPRLEPDGTFVGYVGSCTDVTDVKHAQEEVFARQKLESVGTLAGGVAHDFNNLLGSVLAHAQLAKTELDDSSAVGGELQRIETLAIRGAEIVRQLLIYAGQESGDFEPVDVPHLAGEMLELLKVSISKHAVIESSFGEDLPAVLANPAQLRQVIMNLITNASAAIGERDGVIRLSAAAVTVSPDSALTEAGSLPPGKYLRLEVSDTGSGMTPEVRARIFEPFFTTTFMGRGLGLSVVQGIVRAHGGAIHVASAPGRGTTFQVLLPCTTKLPPETEPPTLPSDAEEAAPAAGTILFVEDEEMLRNSVAKMLRKGGFSVLEAGDGTAAMHLIRLHGEEIALVLLDVTLPGMPSRDVFEETRRVLPGMPIVLTSAYGQHVVDSAFADLRIDYFIRKPYQLGALVDLIRDAISSSKNPSGAKNHRAAGS